MNEPLVSVVLTSYNQPELLKKAFESLLNQSYGNIEIVIVDDCSTDPGNKQLIERFKKSYPEKVTAFYQQKNVGIPANKNTGFRLAKGDYITYLDGDDTYYYNKIAYEVETFIQHPDVDIVYSNFDIKDEKGDLLYVWSQGKRPDGFIFKDIVLNRFPDCHTHRCELFKKHVFYDLNFYDEQFSAYHDLDFMLRYSLRYRVAYCSNIGSSYFKNNEASISARIKGLEQIEQQECVYRKYHKEIKEYGIEKEFKKYQNNIQLSKLFFLKKKDTALIFRSYMKHPWRIIQYAKILNFHLKKTT